MATGVWWISALIALPLTAMSADRRCRPAGSVAARPSSFGNRGDGGLFRRFDNDLATVNVTLFSDVPRCLAER